MIESMTDKDWDRLEQLLGEESSTFLKEKYTDTLKGAVKFLYKMTSITEDFNRPFEQIPQYLGTGSPLKKAILLLRLEKGI